MVPLLGMVVVFCAVVGGFALENGRFAPLVQISEGVIICGTALGTLLTANPLPLLGQTARALLRVFRGPQLTKNLYLATLVMLGALFHYARRNGAANGSRKFEEQLDHPEHSVVFRRHARAIRDAGALHFICDTLRLTTLGISPFDVDRMLELDFEARRKVLDAPAETLAALADALPGLGILSAVLGVVITMGSITDLPRIIGQKVGSALVGTFLGIFLSYGFVAPLAAHMARLAQAEMQYYGVLSAAISAFARGMPTSLALEFARRAVPPDLRPGFGEMEAACREASGKLIEMPPTALSAIPPEGILKTAS